MALALGNLQRSFQAIGSLQVQFLGWKTLRRRPRIQKIIFVCITKHHCCTNSPWMSGLWRLTLGQSAVGTTSELWRHTKQLYRGRRGGNRKPSTRAFKKSKTFLMWSQVRWGSVQRPKLPFLASLAVKMGLITAANPNFAKNFPRD